MSNHVEIYDTTLRDGAQGEGVNFSVGDKCRVVEHLDALGVDFVEGGWPGSNPRDVEFFETTCETDPSIQALRRALEKFYPALAEVRLVDYKVCVRGRGRVQASEGRRRAAAGRDIHVQSRRAHNGREVRRREFELSNLKAQI